MSLDWEKQNRLDRARKQIERNRVFFDPDEDFWRAWKDDKIGMRAAGYRVTKVDGEWKVWVEKERPQSFGRFD